MSAINFLKGDATSPAVSGNKIICHVCNDIGGWGRGFVLALSKRWPEPEAEYRTWMTSATPGKLGETQIVKVEDGLYVANMVAQRHVKKIDGVPPIRYEAVEECLQKVAEKAAELKASVHMPRIGCGLAGGEWDEIEKCITNTLLKKDINVYVYDFG